MNSPFLLSVPDDPIEKVHYLARDLAYGASLNLFASTFIIAENGAVFPLGQVSKFHELVTKKWSKSIQHLFNLLQIFGYITPQDHSHYKLTLKAFNLLSQPFTPPTVFISYKQGVSSSFGLLIEARLNSKNVQVFIDRSLKAGFPWLQQIEEKISDCKYFVCLLSPQTLESEIVQKEISIAKAKEKLIIPIWHSEFKKEELSKEFEILSQNHAIVVDGDSAKAYYDAVNELINLLGFSSI